MRRGVALMVAGVLLGLFVVLLVAKWRGPAAPEPAPAGSTIAASEPATPNARSPEGRKRAATATDDADAAVRPNPPGKAALVVEVVDPEGRRVADASVEGGRALADGRFAIAPVEPGLVHVTAGSERGHARGVFVVRADETREVRVVLEPPAPRSGVRCRLDAPEGLGADDGLFDVVTADGHLIGSGPMSRDGTAQWSSGGPPGGSLFARLRMREEHEDRAVVSPEDVPFSMGSDVNPAEVVLRAVRATAVRLAFADPQGRAIPDAAAKRGYAHQVLRGGARSVGAGLWVADGATFRLRVQVPGWLVHDEQHSAAEARDGVLTVTLRPGATLRGQAHSAAKISGVRFTHLQAMRREFAGFDFEPLSDAQPISPDGNFTLTTIPDGEFAVVALHEPSGARLAVLTAEARAGAVRFVEFLLPSLIPMRGRVTNADAATKTAAHITVWSSKLRAFATADADGRFEVLVPEGERFLVTAEQAGRVAEPAAITAVPSGPEVTLRVDRPAQALLRAPRIGLEDAVLHDLRIADGGPDVHATMDVVASDALLLGGLAAGRYEAVVVCRDRRLRATFEVRTGEIIEVPLTQ